jgi:hypothetical protein
MRCGQSFMATGTFWLVMGWWVLAARVLPAALPALLLFPLAAGLVSGLVRLKLPAFPLLLCASVMVVYGILAGMIAARPDDPNSDVGDIENAIAFVVAASGVATCLAAAVGALFAHSVQRAFGEQA